jgi:hypothetical protein
VLRAVTGRDFGFVAYGAPQERLKAATACRRWIEAEGRAAKLTLPAPAESPVGKVLVCYALKGRVVGLDEGGKKVWGMKYDSPWCCQGLPNGHRLLGSGKGRVDEYDADGKLVWSLDGLRPPVVAVRRLHTGNTLVCFGSNDEERLQEFRPDKTVFRQLPDVDRVYDVQRLDNGHALAAFLLGGIVEWDRRGKVVWQVDGLIQPASVQRLADGNTLAISARVKPISQPRKARKRRAWRTSSDNCRASGKDSAMIPALSQDMWHVPGREWALSCR